MHGLRAHGRVRALALVTLCLVMYGAAVRINTGNGGPGSVVNQDGTMETYADTEGARVVPAGMKVNMVSTDLARLMGCTGPRMMELTEYNDVVAGQDQRGERNYVEPPGNGVTELWTDKTSANLKNFDDFVNENISMVLFYAPWSTDNALFARVLTHVAENLSSCGELRFGRINTESEKAPNSKLAHRLGITRVPTLVFFPDGPDINDKYEMPVPQVATIVEWLNFLSWKYPLKEIMAIKNAPVGEGDPLGPVDGIMAGMVQEINSRRSLHGVPKISWSQTLEKKARMKAEMILLKGCQASLSDLNSNDSSSTGETLLVANGGDINGKQVIDSWFNDLGQDPFDFTTSTCKGASPHKCDAYTQMLWAATKDIGCASQNCNDMGLKQIWICFYSPRGNVQGEYEKNVFAASAPTFALLQTEEGVEDDLAEQISDIGNAMSAHTLDANTFLQEQRANAADLSAFWHAYLRGICSDSISDEAISAYVDTNLALLEGAWTAVMAMPNMFSTVAAQYLPKKLSHGMSVAPWSLFKSLMQKAVSKSSKQLEKGLAAMMVLLPRYPSDAEKEALVRSFDELLFTHLKLYRDVIQRKMAHAADSLGHSELTVGMIHEAHSKLNAIVHEVMAKTNKKDSPARFTSIKSDINLNLRVCLTALMMAMEDVQATYQNRLDKVSKTVLEMRAPHGGLVHLNSFSVGISRPPLRTDRSEVLPSSDDWIKHIEDQAKRYGYTAEPDVVEQYVAWNLKDMSDDYLKAMRMHSYAQRLLEMQLDPPSAEEPHENKIVWKHARAELGKHIARERNFLEASVDELLSRTVDKAYVQRRDLNSLNTLFKKQLDERAENLFTIISEAAMQIWYNDPLYETQGQTDQFPAFMRSLDGIVDEKITKSEQKEAEQEKKKEKARKKETNDVLVPKEEVATHLKRTVAGLVNKVEFYLGHVAAVVAAHLPMKPLKL